MGTRLNPLYLARNFGNVIRPVVFRTARTPKMINISEQDEFKAILTKPIFILKELFEKNNHELRIAGGAVRDILMRKAAADLDFASTATPTEMKDMFEKEGIRMLHKKGEEHGTITCRIEETNLEVTTLRIDVLCDGRKAEVKYTTDWQLDANRRDLTINSMFLDFDGNVIDFFNGIEDVQNRKVAFVGEAEARIQEDFLRILRYFRFFGRISDNKVHDPETLDAIKRNKDGLKGISAERIWTELKRILIGRLAPDVLECMIIECGLSEVLSLPPPEECDFERFRKVFEKHSDQLKSMTCLAALVKDPGSVTKFHRHMKCSNNESFLGEFVASKLQEASEHVDDLVWYQTLVSEMMKPSSEGIYKTNAHDFSVQLALASLSGSSMVAELEKWRLPTFPVNGYDLLQLGVPKGSAIGDVLSQLYDYWQSREWQVEKPELLTKLNEIAADVKSKRKRSPSREKRKKNCGSDAPVPKKPNH